LSIISIPLMPADRQNLRQYVEELRNYILRMLINVLTNELSGVVPKELSVIDANLQGLIGVIADGGSTNNPKDRITLDENLLALLCRAILHKRQDEANKLVEPLGKTSDLNVIEQLEKRLQVIEKFTKETWFINTKPAELPSLSAYISTEYIEKIEESKLKLQNREYDEKFHILISPRLFYSDLNYYRQKCNSRNVGLTVAYLDIDNFKKFNTEYGETTVDRILLPRFMRELESHVYSHGYAYRFGGDEYTVIIPNMALSLSKEFLKEFQRKLLEMKAPGISIPLTVSIGLFYVQKECIYTEREIESFANQAKTLAKNAGKDRIEVFSDKSIPASR